MTLTGVRIAAGLLTLAALALLLYRRPAVARGLHRFFLEPSAPQNLALLRMALFGGLAWVSSQTSAVWWASVPAELRMLPPGWRWLSGVLPMNASLASVAQYVVVIASVCAALGLLTRITAPIAAVVAVYLLGTPSFFGKILHMDHALVLMSLVIAAAPSGDALSLDRLWQRKRGLPEPEPSPAYTLPIRLAWLLLGTIYLFPGIWKVWGNGDLWLNGQRLLSELNDEWGQRKSFDPPMRIDQYPSLLKVLGTSTLIFEVGFFFAIFNRYTRVLAALSAVAFHTGIRMFLGIRFYEYLPLVLLIDFPLFGARLEPAMLASAQLRRLAASALIGGTLLLGQVYVGLAQIDTWPVALHPKFDERTGTHKVASNNQIMLEPGSGAEAQDLGRLMVKLGAKNGFTRVVLSVDRDIAKGVPRKARSRAVVTLLRDSGIAIAAGDHIAIYRTRWNVFPLGERSGFSKSLLRRYRVTEEGGLELMLNAEAGKRVRGKRKR